MGITLANFQLKAIEALMEAMGEPNRDIILKSCTGSGKTITSPITSCPLCVRKATMVSINFFSWLTINSSLYTIISVFP